MLIIPSSPFPVLITERSVLRRLSINDDEEIFALRSNPEVNKYLGRQPAKSIDDARKFIHNIDQMVQSKKGIYWAITLANNDKLVGTICLFNFSSKSDEAEIGFELMPTIQGQGMIQEALEKVIAFGVNVIGIKAILASTHIENGKSTTLLEKLNFKKQEILKADREHLLVNLKLDLG